MIHGGIINLKQQFSMVLNMVLFIMFYASSKQTKDYDKTLLKWRWHVSHMGWMEMSLYQTGTHPAGKAWKPSFKQLCMSALQHPNMKLHRQPASLLTNSPSGRCWRPCFHCFIIQEGLFPPGHPEWRKKKETGFQWTSICEKGLEAIISTSGNSFTD